MITVYLRRLAGFTSFDSKRWRSHFSARGPPGIFESKVIFDPRRVAPRTLVHAHSRGPMVPLRSAGSLRCACSRRSESSGEVDPQWNDSEAAADENRQRG